MEEKIMQKEFNAMINNERNIAHYLIATPFSTVNNMNYGETLKPDFFKAKFLVYDELKKIEMSIIEYLDDISQNTVLITGYQGCGKTTFVNFLAQNLQNYYLEKERKSSISVIDFEEQDDENSKNEDEERDPFKRILINRIIDEMDDASLETKKVYRIFLNGYDDNQKVFKILGNRFNIQILFEFLKEHDGEEFSKKPCLVVELYKLLKRLSIVQILTIWSYFLMCRRYYSRDYNFVDIIIFDNIDDIYNDSYTEGFIRGLKKYHELGSRFAARIKLKDEKFHFNLYSNFNFIFCLRDTSAAKFSFHFTNRAVEFYHVDISEKVNKQDVMNKKIDYLEKTNNSYLKDKSKIIRCICNDKYTIDRIFPFYNNDYRTAIRSLCNVLYSGSQHAQEYFKMTYHQSHAAFHFGAHGIILRIILDSFEKQEYFKLIGSYKENITELSGKEMHDLVDYSIPRIVLTYLFNFQQKHKDNFLNNLPQSTINMKKVYDDFNKVINSEYIAEKLEAMYSLHLKKDWNHLLTVNATYDINSSNINNIFEKYKKGGMHSTNDGSIQITCAGRMFVSRITTHYEYFACRYFPDSKPLFLEENLIKLNEIYKFDRNISDVFCRVAQCVEKAYKFDMKIVSKYFKDDISKFKKSHYLYKYSQTHAERIINHNISYIDAYRHYIIQSFKRINALKGEKELSEIESTISNDSENICKIILEHIKKYLGLMKRYIEIGYFSDNATKLFKQYTKGIENIGTDYLSEKLISFKPL